MAVANRGARPLAGVTVVEAFRDPRPRYDEWRRAREPGEERRNWFDRNVGYFRWRWLIERATAGAAARGEPARSRRGARETLRLTLTPRRRGRIELAGLVLNRGEPLGLVKGLARVPLPERVIALPRRYRLPRLALPGPAQVPARRRVARRLGGRLGGIPLAARVPAGDPLQRIHWKSFARTGSPS